MFNPLNPNPFEHRCHYIHQLIISVGVRLKVTFPICWEVSTGNINDTFNTIDALLKDEMDVLLMPYQFTHADFYNEYRSARSIVDTGGNRKAKTDDPEAD